jgi:hypothetical protein
MVLPPATTPIITPMLNDFFDYVDIPKRSEKGRERERDRS